MFPRTSVSFPMWKNKGKNKRLSFWRVLLGLGETPSRFRTPSFIYVGRGLPQNPQVPRSPKATHTTRARAHTAPPPHPSAAAAAPPAVAVTAVSSGLRAGDLLRLVFLARGGATGQDDLAGTFFSVTRKRCRNYPPPRDRKSTRLNSSHITRSRMPSSA